MCSLVGYTFKLKKNYAIPAIGGLSLSLSACFATLYAVSIA